MAKDSLDTGSVRAGGGTGPGRDQPSWERRKLSWRIADDMDRLDGALLASGGTTPLGPPDLALASGGTTPWDSAFSRMVNTRTPDSTRSLNPSRAGCPATG